MLLLSFPRFSMLSVGFDSITILNSLSSGIDSLFWERSALMALLSIKGSSAYVLLHHKKRENGSLTDRVELRKPKDKVYSTNCILTRMPNILVLPFQLTRLILRSSGCNVVLYDSGVFGFDSLFHLLYFPCRHILL